MTHTQIVIGHKVILVGQKFHPVVPDGSLGVIVDREGPDYVVEFSGERQLLLGFDKTHSTYIRLATAAEAADLTDRAGALAK